MWSLIAPGADAHAALQPLGGVNWAGTAPAYVPIDLGPLAGVLPAEVVGNGIVPRFDDPFTTYRVAGAEVTVYASNYDGALIRGGVLHADLQAHLSDRYGIHRWSDHQWKTVAS